MNYFLYKLQFDSPVHFGSSDSALSLYSSEDHFCADTLFSALCHTALLSQGQEAAASLCSMAEKGELLLSDAMPWKGNDLYIPKPCASSSSQTELPAALRKTVKKMACIPINRFSAFAGSIHGTGSFDPTGAAVRFGIHSESTKVNLKDGSESLPYQVGLFQFLPDCGLWLIAGCETPAQAAELRSQMDLLGLAGIGGKISSGYGKFHVAAYISLNNPADSQLKWLAEAVSNTSARRQLLLTAALPADDELAELLPDAEFRLIRRSGFVQSADHGDSNRKKQAQFYLAAGSVLPSRFAHRLYLVGSGESHPVYRFSGPVFLGVDL